MGLFGKLLGLEQYVCPRRDQVANAVERLPYDPVMADLRTLHRRTMATAEAIVHRVPADRLDHPTPCAGWNLEQLLAHMIGQNHGFASAAAGAPFDDAVWADRPVTDDPGAVFAESSAVVVAAFADAEATERRWHLPAGGGASMAVPGREAMGFHYIDYIVHGWDVAVSIGVQPGFDDDLLEGVLPLAEQVPLEGPTRSSRYAPFASAVPVPEGGGTLGRVLAVLGRSPRWRPDAD